MIVNELENFEYDVGLLNKLHNWLIKKVVGKKAVVMNVTLEISYLNRVEVESTHGMYVANCTMPYNQVFKGK